MSVIIPPKSAGPPKIRTLRVHSKTLKLTEYETPDAYTLFIGGHDLYCIEAMIYKQNSNYVKLLGFPANIGHLSKIYYNINCSLENNFQRGLDTNRILLLMCSYIRKRFPYVDTVSFTDASYRKCDNGIDVELSEMSYLRNGKTWYEKNYGAYMNSADIPKFKKMEDKIKSIKGTMPWNLFKQYIRGELPYPEDDMKTVFENAATWQDFFGPLSDKMGISEFCIFVAPWLHTFFESISGYNFSSAKYYIDMVKLPALDYTEGNYVHGGKRYTRKQRIQKKNYQ